MKLTENQLRKIIRESYEKVQARLLNDQSARIYQEAGLTSDEIREMPRYIDGRSEFYGSTAFDKLYGYFLDSGEMPYGVAKARTGDPDDWILNYLSGEDYMEHSSY